MPSADFLDDLPDPPAPGAAAAPAPADGQRRPDRPQPRHPRPARRFPGHRRPEKEHPVMNNLHRELAPISAAAWAGIEEEARRTFKRHVAGRRVVDVQGPAAWRSSAVGTGHLARYRAPGRGRHRPRAGGRSRSSNCGCRSPCDRRAVDDVERGAKDADWQPVKDAARTIAFAEDRAVFEGYRGGRHHRHQGKLIQPGPGAARRCPRLPEYHQPGGQLAAAGRRRTARTRYCSAPAPTPLSPRRPTTAIPFTSTWPGSSTARSSGRPRSAAPSCSPPAAATTNCTSARTCPSATCPTTPPAIELYLQESLTFSVYTSEAAVALTG